MGVSSTACPVSCSPGSRKWKKERVTLVVTRPSVRPFLARRSIAVVAGVTLAGGLVSYAAEVSAAPQPTVSQVTAQVKSLTTAENKAIQAYDLVNQQLASANESLRQIDAEQAKDQVQFNAMRTDIAQVAAAAYEDGNMTSMATLLTAANPQAVLSKAAMLVQLSSARYTEMHQFVTAAKQLSSAQEQAKNAEAAIVALRGKRKEQAASIGKTLNQKKAILATLTAQEQTTVNAQASAGSGGTTQAHDPVPVSGAAGRAVQFAYGALGCPYLYGGTSCHPGYDCSGLVQAAWAYAGVSIPRDTYEDWADLPHIPLSDLEPGDLILFNGESHVGMYVGGGYLIDAPQPGMTVERVSLSESWYSQTEDGAVRP
jgi:peptidoglycan DL-endopeptidase CwlO